MVDQKVAEGFVEIRLPLGQLERQLGKARRTFTNSLQKIERSFTATGRKLTIALTLPLVAAGIASAKMAATFETNLAKIVGLVGIAADEVERFGKEILKLAPQVGRGPAELSEALFFITSAGLRGAQALETLTASAKAATAGLGTTAIVADAATSATNAFGIANLSATQAVAVLVKTVREGKAAADSIAGSLGQVTGIAAELGVSFDQLGAAIAAMTRLGVSAEEAVTSLRAVFTTFLNPGAQAETILNELGLSFADLRRQLREEGLLATLTTLRQVIGDDQAALAKVIPNVRALTGVLGLVGRNAAATEAIFASLAATTEQDLDAAFLAITTTSAFKFQQALVSIQVASTQLGQVILPILAPVMQDIAAAAIAAGNAFAKLDPEMQKTILTIAAITAIAGPALIALGLLVGAVRSIVLAFGFVLRVLPIVGVAFGRLLFVAVSAISGIITAILTIPGALVIAAGAVFLFKDTIVAAFQAVGPLLAANFNLSFAKIQRDFASLVNTIIKGLSFIKEQAGFEPIKFRLEGVTDEEFRALAQAQRDAAAAFSGVVFEAFTEDLDDIKQFAADAFQTVKDALTGALDIAVLGDFGDQFKTLISDFDIATETLTTSFAEEWEEAMARVTAATEKVGTKSGEIGLGIQQTFQDVAGSISSAITSVITQTTNALDALRNIANAIIGAIISRVVTSVIGVSSAQGNVFSGGKVVPFATGGLIEKSMTPFQKGGVIERITKTFASGGVTAFQNGGVVPFQHGGIVPFQDGGLIGSRTVFPLGLAGEAGPEAILPLARGAGGKLGVLATGGTEGPQQTNITQQNFFSPNVQPTIRQEIADAAGLLTRAAVQTNFAALARRRVA